MDAATRDAYDRAAAAFAAEWEEDQSPPVDLQAIVRRWFPIGATVDIGCGSGRDTAWLAANGYPVIGIDASAGLLDEARRRHPGVTFMYGDLPLLDGLSDGAFDNVLCETVIMHLPAHLVAPAVQRLLALLKRGGTLYVSWRVTDGPDRRDEHGRLYATFDASLVRDALAGAVIELDERVVSASSKKVIHRIVARTA